MRIEKLAALCLASAVWLGAAPPPASAQEAPIDTLVGTGIDHTLHIEIETKLSSIAGEFANFTGMTFTLGMNDRFQIGLGGFGQTNDLDRTVFGYGGLVLGYNLRPERLLQLSLRGLIGAGHADIHGALDHNVFVAEPELELALNVTRSLRIGVGAGYRFVAGAGEVSRDLRGWSGSLNVEFVLFRDPPSTADQADRGRK